MSVQLLRRDKAYQAIEGYREDGGTTVETPDAAVAVEQALNIWEEKAGVYVIRAYPKNGLPFPTFVIIDGEPYSLTSCWDNEVDEDQAKTDDRMEGYADAASL